MLEVSFPYSRSPRYPHAVELAAKVGQYKQTGEGRAVVNTDQFELVPDQLKAAYMLICALEGIRGATVSVDGFQLSNLWSARKALHCYLKSLLVDDYRAYCWKVVPSDQPRTSGMRVSILGLLEQGIKEASKEPEETNDPVVDDTASHLVSPCRFLNGFHHHNLSTQRDQFKAQAVDQEVWWCPNLKLDLFCSLTEAGEK